MSELHQPFSEIKKMGLKDMAMLLKALKIIRTKQTEGVGVEQSPKTFYIEDLEKLW